jgi:hypothetical protein
MENKDHSDFTVRVRFSIPSYDRIGIEDSEAAFASSAGPHVILKSGDQKDAKISESNWLILHSSGWPTEEDATAAVEPLMDALRRTLAYNIMGADFGRRSPRAGFTKAGLRWMESLTGHKVLNDNHGPMVYRTEPNLKFGRAGPATGIRTVQGDRWRKTFSYALNAGAALSERERTAFDLLSGAHSIRDSADARFVLLFAAIETLLEAVPRPQPVVDHVNQLIAFTCDAKIDKIEKESLLGSLKWLRSHSIR